MSTYYSKQQIEEIVQNIGTKIKETRDWVAVGEKGDKGDPFLVKLFDDRIEGDQSALKLGITVVKNSVGDYTLQGTTGLPNDRRSVLLPKDINGNYLLAAEVVESGGDINIKTYEKAFDSVTGDYGVDTSQPKDIPVGHWVEVWLKDTGDGSGDGTVEELMHLTADTSGQSGVYLTLSRDGGQTYTTFNLSDPDFSVDELNRFVFVGEDNSSFAFVAFPTILAEEDEEDGDEFGISGFNLEGKAVTPRHPEGYDPQGIALSADPQAPEPYNSVAYPPYTVNEVTSTITVKATEGVPEEQDIFHSLVGASSGGTITVYSYSTIAFNT